MDFIISFNSLILASKYLNVSTETIKRYYLSGKILLNKYFIK